MCYSLLYLDLPQKNVSLNPEGPLGIYLCDVTFPAVWIACSVCSIKQYNRAKRGGRMEFLIHKLSITC